MLNIHYFEDKEGKLLFELGEEIGEEGQNSKVYLAKDVFLDAELVVKVIKIPDNQILDQYLKESRLLYLSQHNNVAGIQHVSVGEDEVYIAMPYYAKGSLSQLMEERNLTVRDIVKYAFEFISGVSYIHSKGLIHGDIKPTNIFIADNGEALVADFGLAQILDDHGWAVMDGLYVWHCPPEILQNSKGIVGNVSFDIWQIGMTLFRMCIGHDRYCKFASEIVNEEKTVNEKITLAQDILKKVGFPSHIPTKLKKIITKCLSRDVDSRYKTVREILNDLAHIDDDNLLDWEYDFSNEKNSYILNKGDNRYDISEIGNAKYEVIKSTPKKQYTPKTLSGEKALKAYLRDLK